MSASLLIAQAAADNPVTNNLSSRDWIKAGVIVIATLVAAIAASRITRRAVSRWLDSAFAASVTARIVSYVTFLLGLFYALTSLGVQVGPLLGALGLGGLVLALALQKIVESFVAGIILQTRRPFTIGDTVVLGETKGVVVDIDSRTVVVRGLDGSSIRIPNANVVADTTINLTREPYRRSTLDVGVAYDTDLEEATAAIRSAIDLVRRVLDHPAPMIVLSGFGDSTIDFQVLYWHDSDVPSELLARHDLMLAIHRVFHDRGISIAFPQVVVWSGAERDGDLYTSELSPFDTANPASTSASGESNAGSRTSNWRLPRPWR